MKVPIKTDGKYITCYSEDCPHWRQCANHESAGDYRNEGGFRPQMDLFNDEFDCKSYDRPPLPGTDEFSAVPDNIGKLKSGELKVRHIRTADYQI